MRYLLFGALVSGVAAAQERGLALPQFQHAAWTTRDGAPADVHALAQTADGFLWLGTGSGLFRFDGVRFEYFESAGGQPLPSENISALFAHGDALWIGYVFGGASVLRHDTLHTFATNDGSQTLTVWAITRDSDGTTWAGASGGLFRLESGRWHRVGTDRGFSGTEVHALLVDRRGCLWAATIQGVFMLERGAQRFALMRTWPPTTYRDRYLQEAPDGGIWLSSRPNGVERVARGSDSASEGKLWPAMRDTYAFYIDGNSDRWVGTDSGLRHVGAVSELLTPSRGLSGRDVEAILGDREGNVWVGTSGGLDRFQRPKLVKAMLPIQTEHLAIAAAESSGVWLASGEAPLMKVRDRVDVFPEVPKRVDCAYRDPSGVLWLASADSLWRSAGRGFEHMSLPKTIVGRSVQALAVDRSGALWISVPRTGVYRLANGAWTPFGAQAHLLGQPAIALTADRDGRTWLSYTGNRVAVVDGDRVHLFTVADGLEIGNVLSITVRGPHVWAGGDRGLALLDGNRFRTVVGSDGVAFRGVSGIVETSDGELWLDGGTGITRIPTSDIQRVAGASAYRVGYERLDYHDGLGGATEQIRPLPTAIEASDGKIWFATTTDLFWIDPKAIVRNHVVPSVVIRSLTAGGKTYTIGQDLLLPVHTTALHIDYTALSLSMPDRVRFRYRLIGSDTTWQDVGGHREAIYTNLHPGSYRFRVIAANEDGLWNQTGATFAFVIPPSFTQSRWFLVLWVSALGGVAWLLYMLRLRTVADRLRARYQVKLAERTRIAQELHDTLLQGFSGITMQLQALRTSISGPSETADTLDRVLGTADSTLRNARDMIWDIRGTELESQSLADALECAAQAATAGTHVELEFESRGEPRRLPLGVEMTVLRVGREAILNALKHAAPRTIRVDLAYAQRELALHVRDDGHGLAPGAIEAAGVAGHWGIAGMRQRARLAGGVLTIVSGPGQGTTVSLSLPLGREEATKT
jgi:signal transduction histidine kinase/ligand-binding sensor domain-containing protein